MSDSAAAGTAVWTRTFDEAASARRWARFRRWGLLPAGLGLGAAFVLGGAGAMLGVLILVGGLVGMWALLLWLADVLMKQNPEIRLVDGRLIQGRRSVEVAAIERWTTHRIKRQSRTMPGAAAHAIFRLPLFYEGERGVRADGGPAYELVHFAWGEMPPDELEEVRAALAPHIPAPWVPVEGIRE